MANTKRQKLAINGAADVRRETFNGLPIVDAKADFTLIVRTEAVKAAKGNEKDAANCILAKACAKQVGASIVAFFRRTAYLELPDAKGNRRVVRYILDTDAAAIVAAFDRGKNVKGEVMVTLKAPQPYQTLDSIRERGRESKRRQREAVLRGEIDELVMQNRNQKRLFKKPHVTDIDVRSGTGLVQNSIKKSRA